MEVVQVDKVVKMRARCRESDSKGEKLCALHGDGKPLVEPAETDADGSSFLTHRGVFIRVRK